MQEFIQSWFKYNQDSQVTDDTFKYQIFDFISRNFEIDSRKVII